LAIPFFVFAMACTVAIWAQAVCSAVDYGKYKHLEARQQPRTQLFTHNLDFGPVNCGMWSRILVPG
jgi:hypothetical protein